MLNNKTIAVVVPAYNEESQISTVLKSMPAYVDRIIVVDDKSSDRTVRAVKQIIKQIKKVKKLPNAGIKIRKTRYNRADVVASDMREKEEQLYVPHIVVNDQPDRDRIILIQNKENGGVGASIANGYKWCRDNKIDCTAVMAGDGQMDPSELKAICQPVLDGEVDYVKNNRLLHRSAFLVIPKLRYFGNSILSLMTKVASGYWRISDTQTGYTAISLRALEGIRLHQIYRRYGMPNDMLVKLNISSFAVKEVPTKPVYNVGEKSKMKIFKVIPRIGLLLFVSFWKRLYVKYLFRDFHPLFLLYHMAFLILIADIPFAYWVIRSLSPSVTLPLQYLIIFIFLTISGLQSLLFAMWMDMMDNDRLQKV